MKKFIRVAPVLFIAAAGFIVGCSSSSETKNDGNMGVVGETKKGGCCQQKDGDKPADGSMGVVSDKKSCEDKSHCTTGGTCPMQGKDDKHN